MKNTTSNVSWIGSAALLAVFCGGLRAQVLSTVGGAATVGPPATTYYQPKAVIDEALLETLMKVQAPAAVLAPDDQVEIEVFGVKDFDTKARIERDGTVQLPFLGPLKLAGLTVSEAENKIDAALISQQIVLQPAVKITVSGEPSASVEVSGEVPHPGSFAALANVTLERAISQAGGLLQDSSPVVTITRVGYATPIPVPLGPDQKYSRYGGLALLPGDRVMVSKVGVYYVVGAIKNQGSYPLKSTTPTTVAEAIAAAGGFGFEALLNDAQIVRTEGDHRVFVPVRAGQILKGKTPDVALLNDDILFVPTSLTKAAIKGGATGLIVSLASTYIYAHP